MGGVYPARGQDSSVDGGTGNNCLGVVHMEEGVQVRVQVEVGREEQGEGETHGEGQNQDTTRNKQTLNRSSWMTWRWNDPHMQTLEPSNVICTSLTRVKCMRKMTCEVYLFTNSAELRSFLLTICRLAPESTKNSLHSSASE